MALGVMHFPVVLSLRVHDVSFRHSFNDDEDEADVSKSFMSKLMLAMSID